MVNSDSFPQIKNFTHDINPQMINAILSLNKRAPATGGGAAWGSITGTLSSQTDLQTALNGKTDVSPTAPAVRSVGTAASGTGDITPGLPAGHTTNDILLLFVETANQAVTNPAGYTQIGPQNGVGTAASSGSTRLTIFWKRDGGSESAPTVTDAGNRTQGVIIAVSGCRTTGNPFYFQWNGYKKTASTTWTHLGNATTINNSLIIYGLAQGISANNVSQLSSVANASLSSVTTQYDNSTNDGVGGGIGVVSGLLATAGSYGSLTATEGSSTSDVSIALAMIPNQYISGAAPTIEIYNYLTGGSTDKLNLPANAKSIRVIAIAGGGAGGAGIASTAAGGGGGGGGGKWVKDFSVIELTLPIQVNVGSGGVGGATKSAATNSSVKNNNGSGNTLVNAVRGIIGSDATSNSGGGGGAGGGTNGAATAFGYSGANGGSGGSTGAAPNACEDGGGGGGGGKNASNTTGVGGVSNGGGGGGGGGGSTTQGANGGVGGGGQAGGTNNAGAGGNATETLIYTVGGSGGGGGGTGNGGNGAQPGGGGGGGGGAANNGGNGADGAIVIIVYY
jgi:hypothetical protein